MATKLDWVDMNVGAAQEDGFKVYRSPSPIDLAALTAPIATLPADTITYDDLTAPAGDNHYIVSTYRDGVVRFSDQKMITLGGGAAPLSAYPAAIFASGEDGTVLDPTVLSSMWQDVAGTVPVAADGDPVALWQDQSGNGNHLTQADPAKRPIYRAAGGKKWLEFGGAAWLQFTTGALNFANLSVHMGLQSHWVTSSTIIGVGHSEPRSSPWWRWVLFESSDAQKRISNTLNGSAKLMPAPGFRTVPKAIGFDTVSGNQFVAGSVVSSFAPLVVAYPNSTTCLIGANSAGGEVATIDVYGLLIVDRGLSALEVADTDSWISGLIAAV